MTWIMMDTLDILNMYLEDKEITLLKRNGIPNWTIKSTSDAMPLVNEYMNIKEFYVTHKFMPKTYTK